MEFGGWGPRKPQQGGEGQKMASRKGGLGDHDENVHLTQAFCFRLSILDQSMCRNVPKTLKTVKLTTDIHLVSIITTFNSFMNCVHLIPKPPLSNSTLNSALIQYQYSWPECTNATLFFHTWQHNKTQEKSEYVWD